VIDHDGVRALVFLGSLLGHSSPAPTYTPLLGAELTVPAGTRTTMAVDPTFEHGALIDTGHATVAGVAATPGQLVYQGIGSSALTIATADTGPARLLLLGGQPLGEQIVMWWNFIGRSHEEIVEYRTQWQAERAERTSTSRFGCFPAAWEHTLPAPGLPNTRLRPRD
jgi:redox-sensitive bicupin YhaK (pirin superfamily)